MSHSCVCQLGSPCIVKVRDTCLWMVSTSLRKAQETVAEVMRQEFQTHVRPALGADHMGIMASSDIRNRVSPMSCQYLLDGTVAQFHFLLCEDRPQFAKMPGKDSSILFFCQKSSQRHLPVGINIWNDCAVQFSTIAGQVMSTCLIPAYVSLDRHVSSRCATRVFGWSHRPRCAKQRRQLLKSCGKSFKRTFVLKLLLGGQIFRGILWMSSVAANTWSPPTGNPCYQKDQVTEGNRMKCSWSLIEIGALSFACCSRFCAIRS